MPTWLRWKGYRFFCYSADGWEPPHVHVVRDGKEAKIWLNEIEVAMNMGFSAVDITEILRKVREEQPRFLAAWHAFFGE